MLYRMAEMLEGRRDEFAAALAVTWVVSVTSSKHSDRWMVSSCSKLQLQSIKLRVKLRVN